MLPLLLYFFGFFFIGFFLADAATRGVLWKKPKACKFIKKETLTQVFSCEFSEISKSTFYREHLWTTASIFRNCFFCGISCMLKSRLSIFLFWCEILCGCFRFLYVRSKGGSRAAATSKMECFVIIVNGFQSLTIIAKHSIFGCCSSPRSASEKY